MTRVDSVDDIELALVRRARRGDGAAFEQLLQRYDRRLRALAYRILDDRDLMDDALQEVAIKAFLSLPRFRQESAVGTWLFRLTYTTCLNVLRSRSRRPQTVTDEFPDLPVPGPDLATALGDREALRAALALLSPQQRVAVLLVMEQGWDLRSAGEVLGIPKGTVASRLSAARATLREALRESDRAREGS